MSLTAALIAASALTLLAARGDAAPSVPPERPAAEEASPEVQERALPRDRRALTSVALGVLATRVEDVRALGVAARVAWGRPGTFLGTTPAANEIALELGAGRTQTHLPVAEIVASGALWTDPARPVRAGLGVGIGAFLFRRATTGRWDASTLLGPRLSVRWDAIATQRTVTFFELGADLRALAGEHDFAWNPSAVLLVGTGFRGPRPVSAARP